MSIMVFRYVILINIAYLQLFFAVFFLDVTSKSQDSAGKCFQTPLSLSLKMHCYVSYFFSSPLGNQKCDHIYIIYMQPYRQNIMYNDCSIYDSNSFVEILKKSELFKAH